MAEEIVVSIPGRAGYGGYKCVLLDLGESLS